MALFSVLQQRDYLTHKGTFAGGRARVKRVLVQTMAGAAVRAGSPLFKNGTAVEVPESVDLKRKCCFAGMIEKKQTGHQILEMHLVADDFNLGIAKKLISVLPDKTTIGTYIKMCHSINSINLKAQRCAAFRLFVSSAIPAEARQPF